MDRRRRLTESTEHPILLAGSELATFFPLRLCSLKRKASVIAYFVQSAALHIMRPFRASAICVPASVHRQLKDCSVSSDNTVPIIPNIKQVSPLAARQTSNTAPAHKPGYQLFVSLSRLAKGALRRIVTRQRAHAAKRWHHPATRGRTPDNGFGQTDYARPSATARAAIASASLAHSPQPESESASLHTTARSAHDPCPQHLSSCSHRVGLGYDVHRFAQDRPLWLGGVRIEHPLGLDGHSDADVVLHAIADALLGASALGDIGQHFPDTDPAYAGANSCVLLAKVAEMLHQRGFVVVNVDVTVIAEEPHLAPYRNAMRENISSLLRTDLGAVSVKATTNERMGALGRGEGIAALAVVLISQNFRP